MKILLLLLFVISFLQTAIAQDTLFRVNGESIGVKVLEVTPLEIKYKLTSNLEGPTYTVFKSDVFMIEYANGSKDVFGVQSPKPKENVATSDSLILNEEKKLRGLIGGGYACAALGGAGLAISVPFLIAGIVQSKDEGSIVTIVSSGFGAVISAILVGAGVTNLKKARLITKKLEKNGTASLNLSPELLNTTAFRGPIINRGNGIGVRLSLTF